MENNFDPNRLLKTVLFFYMVFIATGLAIIPFTPQLDFIDSWQNPSSTMTIKFFQFFSDSISFFSFGIPALITARKEFKHDTNKKRNRLSFLFILLSIAVAGLVSRIIKEVYRVPRPYETDLRILQLSVGGGYSFPSGHTTEAFASAMAITLLFPKWAVIVPLFGWASLVALSRIYLGVHYPVDIFAGMFIGSTVAMLFYKFYFRQKLMHVIDPQS